MAHIMVNNRVITVTSNDEKIPVFLFCLNKSIQIALVYIPLKITMQKIFILTSEFLKLIINILKYFINTEIFYEVIFSKLILNMNE